MDERCRAERKYWKRLEEWRVSRAFSGNFPRRYYPDRVQRVSLSLAALPTVPAADAREAPLFRRGSLKHERRRRCKPGLPAFYRPRRHSGTMPRTRFAARSREIKRTLRQSRNNSRGRKKRARPGRGRNNRAPRGASAGSS
jgi:hypothetical protein